MMKSRWDADAALVYASRFFGSQEDIEKFLDDCSDMLRVMIDAKDYHILRSQNCLNLKDLQGSELRETLNSINLYCFVRAILQFSDKITRYSELLFESGMIEKLDSMSNDDYLMGRAEIFAEIIAKRK